MSKNYEEIGQCAYFAKFLESASSILDKILGAPKQPEKAREHECKGSKINKILSKACDKASLRTSVQKNANNDPIQKMLLKLNASPEIQDFGKNEEINDLKLLELKQVKNNVFYLLSFECRLTTFYRIEVFQLEQAMYVQSGFQIDTRHRPLFVNLDPKHNVLYLLDSQDRFQIFDLSRSTHPLEPVHSVPELQRQLGECSLRLLSPTLN